MTVPVLPLARTSAAAAEAVAEEEHRLERKYRRRRLVHRIDRAIDECERANLAGAGGAPPPARAAALVEELQQEAGEPASRPRTAMEALNELFRLQEPYLHTARFADNAGDLDAERTPVDPAESGEQGGADDVIEPGPELLLSGLCRWLETVARPVQHRELPPAWQALLRARASSTLSVVYYHRGGRGGWRPYSDWRRRLQQLADGAASGSSAR